MYRGRVHPRRWCPSHGETWAPGATLPGAVAPVGATFDGSCRVVSLRAGRVSTATLVFDSSLGAITVWKAIRATDRKTISTFRRECERWVTSEPPPGCPASYGLRQRDEQTFLTQELIPGVPLVRALEHDTAPLSARVHAATWLCETARDLQSRGMGHAAAFHPDNLLTDGLPAIWLTDPTTARLGRHSGKADLMTALGRRCAELFGVAPTPSAAARALWDESSDAERQLLLQFLARCEDGHADRYTSPVGMVQTLQEISARLPSREQDAEDYASYEHRLDREYRGAVRRGYQLLRYGCPEIAEGAFRRALAAAPWAPDARLGLAEARIAVGEPDEAVVLAQAAIGDAAEDAGMWRTLGVALLSAGKDMDRAIAALETARRLQPNDPAILLSLADAHESQGRLDEAGDIREAAFRDHPTSGEIATSAAFTALERADAPGAVERFTVALRANPLDMDAWQGRALALESCDAFAAAGRSVEVLAYLHPLSAEFRAWWRRLALFGERPDVATSRGARAAQQALDMVPPIASAQPAESRGDLETALGAMEHSLHLRPDAVALWCLKGELLAALDQHDEAATCFARATELDPDMGAAWLGLARARLSLGDEHVGFALIQQALTARRPMPAAGLLGAELLWQQGRRSEARRLLDFTIAMAPAWRDAWRRMANWAERTGDYQAGLRAGEALQQLPRHEVEGLIVIARSLSGLGRHEEALAAARRVLEADRDSAEALGVVAEVERANGMAARARHTVRRAIEIDPTQSDLWCTYARTLLDDADGRGATAVVGRATELAPDSGSVWRTAGEVYSFTGQYRHASHAFGRALKQDMYDVPSWNGLTHALLKQDRPRAALVGAHRLVAMQPERAEHWCLLGQAHLGAGSAQTAAQSFDRAISLAPRMVQAWHLLAVTELLLERVPAALRNWQRVLTISPEHPGATEGIRRLRRLRQKAGGVGLVLGDVLVGLPDAPSRYRSVTSSDSTHS